jgi:hypothetical protein
VSCANCALSGALSEEVKDWYEFAASGTVTCDNLRAGVIADNDDVFDVIVIGMGPPGWLWQSARCGAVLLRPSPRSAWPAGECEYYACLPSKALLRPVGLAPEVDRMPGLELRGPIDPAAVLPRQSQQTVVASCPRSCRRAPGRCWSAASTR